MNLDTAQSKLVKFLDGTSRPAVFHNGGSGWVVKYINPNETDASSLRLASELVACQAAQALGVASLIWEPITITTEFQLKGERVPTGIALVTGEESNYFECCENLRETFWLLQPYRSQFASMVILDNWIMNRDRPRGGNTLYWEPKERPSKVLFIDHDRSFVGTPTDRAPQADNVHWVSDDFRDEWLGFDIKRSRSSSEYVDILSRKEPNGCELLLADFAKPLRLMQETNADAIRGWVGNIPREWGLEDLTETWVNRFLTRRDLVVEAFRREYGHVPI